MTEAGSKRPRAAAGRKLVKPEAGGKDKKFTNAAGKHRAKPKGTAGRAGPGRLSRLSKPELIDRLINLEDDFWADKAELGEFSERPVARPKKTEGMIAWRREQSFENKVALAKVVADFLINYGDEYRPTRKEYAAAVSAKVGRRVTPTTMSRKEYKEVIAKGRAVRPPKAAPYARSERVKSLNQAPTRELKWRILQLEKDQVRVGERTEASRTAYASKLERISR